MSQPNFVVIMTDTQGANVVGAYGRPEMGTPNLDRLAGQGTLFRRAYTTSPVCGPARAGIFTGSYPHTAGAWGNDVPLGNTIKTMGQRFGDHGYRSAYIGKWHLSGHDYFDTGICPDGWEDEYWYDAVRYMQELTDEQVDLWRRGLNDLESLRRHKIGSEFTWGHRASDRAIRFLQSTRADQPFLLVVSYDEPHGPFTCPPQYVERFQDFRYDLGPGAYDDLAGKPAHHRAWARDDKVALSDGKVSHPMYFGCNSYVDAQIGRVLAAVDRYAAKDTYVIFTSDHGDLLGAHRMKSKGPNMYEEITRIPLLIRQPRGVRAGVVDDALVSHIDLLPTMLELAGLEAPPVLVGRSLAGRLAGETESFERSVLVEFHRYEAGHDYTGLHLIRCWLSGDYKLVINLLEDRDELYNLREDPAELHNRIDNPADAATRDRMHDELLDYMNQIIDPFRGYCWERRPWRSSRRFGWTGQWRPYPEDGYAPPIRDYRTGRPNTGARAN